MNLREMLDALPSQFDRAVEGRILLLDGDLLCYQAAATVKTLKTALRRFQTLVETERFLTEADEVRVHLTASNCTKLDRFYYPTVKVYQANRTGKAKPPLLEPLRRAAATCEWPDHIKVFLWNDLEADDALMIDAVRFGENAVMNSRDKDLRITPGPYWEQSTAQIDIIENRFGWVDLKETASDSKIVGHGTKFFWAQMLAGDTADNVKGIRLLNNQLCGDTRAIEFLSNFDDERTCAIAVLEAYMEIEQDPLAEAECLWLRRTPFDNAYTYFRELLLPAKIDTWLTKLHDYHKEYIQYMKDNEVQEDDSPPWEE